MKSTNYIRRLFFLTGLSLIAGIGVCGSMSSAADSFTTAKRTGKPNAQQHRAIAEIKKLDGPLHPSGYRLGIEYRGDWR